MSFELEDSVKPPNSYILGRMMGALCGSTRSISYRKLCKRSTFATSHTGKQAVQNGKEDSDETYARRRAEWIWVRR